MKKTGERTYTHKEWNVYRAGPFYGFPKRYVIFPPEGFPGGRYQEATLAQAKQLIDGLLALEAFNARLRWEDEWIEIEE